MLGNPCWGNPAGSTHCYACNQASFTHSFASNTEAPATSGGCHPSSSQAAHEPCGNATWYQYVIDAAHESCGSAQSSCISPGGKPEQPPGVLCSLCQGTGKRGLIGPEGLGLFSSPCPACSHGPEGGNAESSGISPGGEPEQPSGVLCSLCQGTGNRGLLGSEGLGLFSSPCPACSNGPVQNTSWFSWPTSQTQSGDALDDGETVPAPVDAPDCPICYESISAGDAAMRCAGAAGVNHCFHKQCLGTWVNSCLERRTTPTCPVCRGSVLVNVGKLSSFLDSPEAAHLPADEIGALQHLLARARATLGTASHEEAWAQPFNTDDAITVGIVGAAVTAGFVAAYADGAVAVGAEIGILAAPPTPATQIAAATGYVAGLTVRVVQGIVQSG